MESLEALPVSHVKLSVSPGECSSVVHHFPPFYILWLYYETPIFTLFANNNATNNLHCHLQMFKNADVLIPMCLSCLEALAASMTAVEILFVLRFLNKILCRPTKQEMLAV